MQGVMSRVWVRCALAVSLAAAAAAPVRAELVTNGSFETGDRTGWSYFSYTNFLGQVFEPRATDGSVTTTGGTRALGLGNGFYGYWIEQTISTVAQSRYRISFDLGILSPSSTNSREDLLTVTDGAGSSLLNESLISNTAFTAPLAPNFKSYVFEFDAVGSSTTFRFTNTSYTPFASSYLDQVSVVALDNTGGGGSVPLPGTAWLAGLGLLAVAGVRRKG